MEVKEGTMEGVVGMNGNFWHKKKVLVTGHEGFLGSHLTRALLAAKAQVVGLDTVIARPKTVLTDADRKKIVGMKGSVENFSLLQRIMKEHKVECIFHLAAKALVGECTDDPRRAFSVNIEGTWNILECSRMHAVGPVVIASSDKAYGSHDTLPYTEDAPLIGNHPYDVSKSCADLIAYTYFHTYGVPVAVTRCGNIYGPGDYNFSRLIPDAICSALQGKPLIIRSDGTFTRDYVFVDDIVSGYMRLAENLELKSLGGEAFNFSAEAPLSVGDLVKKIYRLCKSKENCVIEGSARFEIKDQYLAAGKARRILGWKARTSLTQGLHQTIGWYARNAVSCINRTT